MLDFREWEGTAGGVVGGLVFADAAYGEVARGWVGEQEAADAGGRGHREGLGQGQAEIGRAEQVEQLVLETVVGAGRIAERRADAAEALGVQVLDRGGGLQLEPLVARG